MTSKNIREKANQSLKGKIGKITGCVFVYLILTYLMSYIPLIGGLTNIVIGPVLLFGIYKSIVLIVENKNVGVFDFFKFGFEKFSKVWLLVWEVLKKTWIPLAVELGCVFFLLMGIMLFSILVIIIDDSDMTPFLVLAGCGMLFVFIILIIGSSIWYLIKSLKYALVNFYLIENPNLSAKEIMNLNEKNMERNNGRIGRLYIFYYLISLGAGFLGGVLIWVIEIVNQVITMCLYSVSEDIYVIFSLILQLVSGMLSVLILTLASVFIVPRQVVSYYELYKDLSRKEEWIYNRK